MGEGRGAGKRPHPHRCVRAPPPGSSEGRSPGSWEGNAGGREVFEEIMGEQFTRAAVAVPHCSWGLRFIIYPSIYFPLSTLRRAASAALNPGGEGGGHGGLCEACFKLGPRGRGSVGTASSEFQKVLAGWCLWGPKALAALGMLGATENGDAELELDPCLMASVHSCIHSSLIHSLIHSLIAPSCLHSLIHSFIWSLIHSLIHSVTHLLLIHSVSHSFIHLFTPSFTPLLLHSFTHSLICSLPHSFSHSFTNSFIRSLIPSFICWFIHSINLY